MALRLEVIQYNFIFWRLLLDNSSDDLAGEFGPVPNLVKGPNTEGNTSGGSSGRSFVDDRFDLENSIQTKAELSYSIAVMDKI